MKKYIIILIGLVAFGGFVYQNRSSQVFGAFGDPFLSIQLASSPANGECLTTDGTNNDWASCGSGSGGIGDPFTHPATGQSATTSLMLFNGQASSTQLSAYQAYFGGTGTTTILANGNVGIGYSSPGGKVQISRASSDTALLGANAGDTSNSHLNFSPTSDNIVRWGIRLTDTLKDLSFDARDSGGSPASLLYLKRPTASLVGMVGISSTTPNFTLSVGSSNTGKFGISTTTDGCATFTKGELWSSGSACGSGAGGGASNPFTNSSQVVNSTLGTQYTSATTSALRINSYATTTIGNFQGTMWVPTDFATNGCAGNATYTDFGQCVNGLYSLASTSGQYAVVIKIPNIKVTSAQWTTGINFNDNGLTASLQCERGAELYWGGTGTSTVFNMGNPTGHYVSDNYGCAYRGNTTLIAAAQTNTKMTGGIYFGGNQGAVGVIFRENDVNGFGINLGIGANAYMLNINYNSISGGNGTSTDKWGSLLTVDVASNSGERNNFIGNSFTDPGNSYATSSIYITSGGTASNYFAANSFDNAGIYCGASNGTCSFIGNHFENPGAPSSYPQYIPIVNPSSDGSTQLTLIGNQFANSASNQTWKTIVLHGGQLYAASNNIQNYNGFTVTNFADHSNNNGQSSDHICQTQVQGGTLTNLVAGGGGIAWSLTNGVACSINRANSYTIGMRPLSTNVNQIYSGSSIVADFDHSGNWNLGEDVSNSTVTINKNLVVDTNGYFGSLLRVATTTSVYPFEAFSASQSQIGLSAGAGIAKWTLRNAGGSFFISSTTVAGNATTSTPAFSILSSGEVVIRNIFQIFSVAGTKLMDVALNVVTLLGTWDFSGATVKEHTYSSFSYATSTAWNATTTIPLGPAYTAESWTGVKCFTDTGTLNVSFNDGTNRMDIVNASTTVGGFLFSTNNTFTSSEKRYVDIGTPASSPTRISCTVDKIVNN